MASNGHFDFGSQTWVNDGEEAPPPRTSASSLPRRPRGLAERILLTGGIIASAVGLLLLVAGVSSDPISNTAAFIVLLSLGFFAGGIGVSFLTILLIIHAVLDVWQRRMRQPE